jgi:hypothetical protein
MSLHAAFYHLQSMHIIICHSQTIAVFSSSPLVPDRNCHIVMCVVYFDAVWAREKGRGATWESTGSYFSTVLKWREWLNSSILSKLGLKTVSPNKKVAISILCILNSAVWDLRFPARSFC